MTLNTWNGLPDPKMPMTTQTEEVKMNQEKQLGVLRLVEHLENFRSFPDDLEAAAEHVQQERKPLTVDEIERIYSRYGGDMVNCTRAIERHHGITQEKQG